ncbi:MAG: phosphatase PAP2 family protein [Clostridia bacterium]|nr:phosphatase PAP2 family protein [Clostridia bacterium]
MRQKGKRTLVLGVVFLGLFGLWTAMIQLIDVQPIGPKETNIGFSTFNNLFHDLTGVNMTIYNITDWMGLIPIFICMVFGLIGLIQLIKRKSLLKVDHDILILGMYYIVVILCYSIFEILPINYRPILIEGYLEASYPSSTTLLVLSVMLTLVEFLNRRINKRKTRMIINIIAISISIYMVMGRLICGVHWFTDIVGSVLLSMGLFCIYKALILICLKNN